MKHVTRCGWLAMAWTLLVGCAAPAPEGGSQEDELRAEVHAKFSIPLREVSGLALRERASGLELLAIGDSDYRVAVGRFSGNKVQDARFELLSLEAPFAPYRQAAGSQWEAVASDASGRLFILEENPGRLFVLDAEGAAIERVISLRIDAERTPELAASWQAEANSRGEGLVLLRNGHVLVLKEKRERALIEFGPEGDEAEGYDASAAVGRAHAFSLPAAEHSEWVALRSWAFDKKKQLPDASELAVTEEGGLLVLSDEGQAYAEAELPITPDTDSIALGERVRVPSCEKPEGMVVLPNGRVVVASDQRKEKNNTVVLKP